MSKLVAVVASLVISSPCRTQAALATWEPSGVVNSANPLFATGSPSVFPSALSLSPNLTPTLFSSAFVADGWPAGPLDPTKYFEFTVTPLGDAAITHDRVQFSLYNNFTGVSSWALRSSVDGFIADLDTGTATAIAATGQVVIADTDSLGTRPEPVTFRLYTFNNSGSSNPLRRGIRGNDQGGIDLTLHGVAAPYDPNVTLASWELDGLIDPLLPSPVTQTSPDVQAGSLIASPAASGLPASSAFVIDSWPLGALDPAQYVEFSVAPTPGFQVDYDTVAITIFEPGSTSPSGDASWELRSSVGGFGSAIASGAVTGLDEQPEDIVIDVSSLPAQAQAVVFRFYLFNNQSQLGDPEIRGILGTNEGGEGIFVRGIVEPVPSYPGTGEDLQVEHAVNGGAFTVAAAGGDVRQLGVGDLAHVRYLSSDGTFAGAALVTIGSLLPTGTPVPSPFPGLHAFLPTVVSTEPTSLAPAGFSQVFITPSGLSGLSALVQGLALDASAANGIFASTNGLELRFL